MEKQSNLDNLQYINISEDLQIGVQKMQEVL